jgi:hypothetical protein
MSDEPREVQPTDPAEARPDPDFPDAEQAAFEAENRAADREKRKEALRRWRPGGEAP